ncbi:hypothetical protein JXM83_00090 [Candidatus Woesearchaeota archaeon]|nr:hypothetical protein [Candidatus Delongbacteria bacterium]MBN2880431.1 hypothetical protein [Candidatus Woesearchaeota archaeon]
MEIPNLPTDNLYKFMATSGVVISIVCLILVIISSKERDKELSNIHTEYLLLDYEIEVLHKKDSILFIEISALKDRVDKYETRKEKPVKVKLDDLQTIYSNAENRDLFIFLQKYHNELIPEALDFKNLQLKEAQLADNREILHRKEILLKERSRIWKEEQKRGKIIIWILMSAAIIGSNLAVWGFFLWYKRVQIYLDRQIKNDNNEA